MKLTLLLITTNNDIFQSFQQNIPDNVQCSLVSSESGFLDVLSSKQNKQIAAVFLDLTMQDNDDFCRIVRTHSDANFLPIVAIINKLEDRQRAFDEGAHDYLLYPFVAQEILTRVTPYDLPTYDYFLVKSLEMLKEGIPMLQFLRDDFDRMTTMVGANTACLYLYQKETSNLIHTFPDMCERPLRIEDALHERIRQNTLSLLDIFVSSDEQSVSEAWVSLALTCEDDRVGFLLFKFDTIPQWLAAKRQSLLVFGAMVGHLLEVSQLHQEAQSYATQTAFMVLIAKMLAEQTDLKSMLLMALEHIVILLNAAGGEIWLNASIDKVLVLASDLTPVFSSSDRPSIPYGKGIIGQAFAQRETMQVDLLSTELLAEYDDFYHENGRFLLAVPLYHQDVIGVVAVYHSRDYAFSSADIMLLQGISGLLTSAITNAQLMEELREYAEQQNVLYKMSRQIAAGLDLQTTFDRTLGWATRLCNVEIGLLWLVDEGQNNLQLMATYGLLKNQTQAMTMHYTQGFVGWAVANNETIVANDPQNNPQYDHTFDQQLNISVQNIMVIPMTFHQVVIGALSLINKVGGIFTQDDSTLLTTASDMIAIAIGNAHLHTKTTTLMEERERLHQQTIQSERLAIVGRLTASLAHEINNPMQAIKGAMTLALEEMDDYEALQEYINLSMEQADRVVQLVSRMRRIYRPGSDTPESVQINQVLQEVFTISAKELQRRNVRLKTQLATQLPRIVVVNGQIQLVFLNIILNMAESISKQGGQTMQVSTLSMDDKLRIEFATDVANLPFPDLQKVLHDNAIKETGFGISFSQDIIAVYGGTLQLIQLEDQAVFRIEIPIQ